MHNELLYAFAQFILLATKHKIDGRLFLKKNVRCLDINLNYLTLEIDFQDFVDKIEFIILKNDVNIASHFLLQHNVVQEFKELDVKG